MRGGVWDETEPGACEERTDRYEAAVWMTSGFTKERISEWVHDEWVPRITIISHDARRS